MRKGQRIFLACLLVVALCVFAWEILHQRKPTEPVYQGKPLSVWLDQLADEIAFDDTREAITQIGPKAIPFIIRKLGQNDSPFKNKYRDLWPTLPAMLKNHLPQPKPLRFSASRAADAFDSLGPDATPALIHALNDNNPAVREAAASALGRFIGKSLTTNDAIVLFAKALGDTDAMTRWWSADAMVRIGPAASNAIPALAAALQSNEAGREKGSRVYIRAHSARALAAMGPAAAGTLPLLTNSLSSMDSYYRVQAAIAIWCISSNESIALPVIISDTPKLGQREGGLLLAPLAALTAMGPRAKAAVPMLLNGLTTVPERLTPGDPAIRSRIVDALKAIDPEADAKAGIK